MEHLKGCTLKIAVDARSLADPRGGIRRYTSSILHEIAALHLPHRFFLYSDRPIHSDFELPEHWKVRNGNLRVSGLGTIFAQSRFPLWAAVDRIDVFWAPRHQLPLLLSPNVRKVLTIHDLVWKRHPETMKRGGRLLEELFTLPSIRRADEIITVSQFSRGELLKLISGIRAEVHVVYSGSGLSEVAFPAPSPVAAPYFLFVGSSEPRKNLRRIMQAYCQYTKKVPQSHDFVIAGADRWGDFDLGAFVRDNGLQSRVHLFHDIDDAGLAALYAGAQALVMISLYEGFGLPLVEAMQYGLPLIVSRNSSLEEVGGAAALLADPYDEESIVQVFCQFTESEELRKRLAEAAVDRAKQFSYEKAAAQTVSILTGANVPQRSAIENS